MNIDVGGLEECYSLTARVHATNMIHEPHMTNQGQGTSNGCMKNITYKDSFSLKCEKDQERDAFHTYKHGSSYYLM